MNNQAAHMPCFYLPKQLFNNKYSSFSAESKLLFSMIFTNAEHIKAIKETASLIHRISDNELAYMRQEYTSMLEEKEGA